MMVAVAGAEMRAEEGINSVGNGGGDGDAAAGAATTDKERTRIYVGGLGESVTEDDLRKTFSTLGKLESVDIVRTKGRSFAYLDFLPSSDKSLPKLFSTYNGCMWKGGRLRLEKAKEHYHIRLKREWQEEAENASNASKGNADASEHTVSLQKPKKAPPSDKMQLQIFFPKLKKVKSVAWSGTGKHKYSFQRVEVPALPVHFCDCEEHYAPPMAKEKTLSTLETATGGINEEEINIMNTVMNKLLKREDCSKTAVGESNLLNDRDNSDNSIDDLPAGDEEEDQMTDEDNLIINVVAGEKDRIGLLEKQSLDAIMANQKPISNRSQTSKDKPPRYVGDSQKKKSLPRSKKQKPSDSIEIDENGGKSLQLHLTTPEDEALQLDFGTQQMKSNSSWKQKSAWRNLIGHKGNTKFSITDIIPSEASQKEEEPKTADCDLPSTMDQKEEEPKTAGNTKFSITDIIPSEASQKGEEPKTADRDLPSTTDQKEEEPKTADHDVPCAMDKKEEEPKTADLDAPSITDMKSQDLEKHGDADIQPGQSKDLEKPTEAPPAKLKEVSSSVARGASWLAKSSWTQLVSTTINSPFSICQVLPSLSSEKHDQVTHNSVQVQVVNSTDSEQSTLKSIRNEANGDCSDASGLANKDLITAPHPSSVIPLVKHDHNPTSPGIEQKFTEEKLGEKSELHAPSLEKNQPLTSKQTALGEFEFSETCPFMRTDTSMKEWRKRKVAQSASLRKKRKDDLV